LREQLCAGSVKAVTGILGASFSAYLKGKTKAIPGVVNRCYGFCRPLVAEVLLCLWWWSPSAARLLRRRILPFVGCGSSAVDVELYMLSTMHVLQYAAIEGLLNIATTLVAVNKKAQGMRDKRADPVHQWPLRQGLVAAGMV
ncbi:hypothetical protein BRADI_1g25834v3, partial [Brachypodium distachyon]